MHLRYNMDMDVNTRINHKNKQQYSGWNLKGLPSFHIPYWEFWVYRGVIPFQDTRFLE